MSHLHFPDGVAPWWLWVPALAVTLLLLATVGRARSPQRIAYQGALGGLMLAAMAIPLGPLEYHLTLVGPVAVLLGVAGSLPVIFVVGATLAFVGHGGFTVVGINSLLLFAAAAAARIVYDLLAPRLSAAWSLALASVAASLTSGLLWLALVVVMLRAPADPTPSIAQVPARTEVLAAVTLSLWMVGTLIEALVAFGIGRFLARVHPGLLPLVGAEGGAEAVVRSS